MSPLYEYKCLKCQYVFEVKLSIHDNLYTECPKCKGEVRQLFHPPAVHYKGSGFFSTDNKPDTRVRGESGKLGRRVSETDRSNIDAETPTRTDTKGRPHFTPTRPKPAAHSG